ncbi:unnamed protein product [Ascophyllum nodosum]
MRKLAAFAFVLATHAGVAFGATVDAGEVTTVEVDAPLYDTRLSVDGGCDPSGCIASMTRDGDLTTTDSRWSCKPELSSTGETCSITYTLADSMTIEELSIAMYKGDERTRTMDIYVDSVLVTTWTNSGTTVDFETVTLGVTGSTIEVRGVLEDSEWLSIMEVEVLVVPATSAATPAPTTASTGELEPVGPIPLASGAGDTATDRYYAKDNDFSTSWSCDESTETDGDCNLIFNLFWYRHIKQVKIALSNGADEEVYMKIGTEWSDDDPYEIFVTSSGTTTDFEAYDFDVFTDQLVIAGYVTGSESISIAEVEFVEEVQATEMPVMSFDTPYDSGDGSTDTVTTDAFEWWSESDDALDEELVFELSTWVLLTAVELQFPTGDTYLFELELYTEADSGNDPFTTLTGLESENTTGWQTFELQLDANQTVTEVHLIMKGTGSGASGFYLLDARFIGSLAENPTDIYYVGTTRMRYWYGSLYPDFVGEGTGDQEAIMGAICAVKKASFDGVDCVDEDAEATGTVTLTMGDYYVDGNIFMKSGVFLNGDYSIDDSPHTTDLILEDDAAGNTAIDAIIVVDGVTDAVIEDVWIEGLYDPDTSNNSSAIAGLGSTAISITNSQNIEYYWGWITNMDGDAIVVRDSQVVSIDAGSYDEEYLPHSIASNRGTGLLVDNSEDIYVRRHAFFDNGVAGISIMGSTNFTFEATIDSSNDEGEGYVGSLDGQQPIEVIIDSSNGVTFQDVSVKSTNDPVMTVSADSSDVSFNNCGFSSVDNGTCVIQTEDPSVVTAEDDELELVGTCYVKV